MAIQLLYRFIPAAILKRTDPEKYGIEQLVIQASRDVLPGQLIFDAGAGECLYRSYFRHAHYLAGDYLKGGAQWGPEGNTYGEMDLICDMNYIPLQTESMDAVLSTQVLEHMPDTVQALKELHRVLKCGSALFLSVPLGGPGFHGIPYDYHRFTPSSLSVALEKAGFQLERIEPRGGFFWEMGFMLRLVPRILMPRAFSHNIYTANPFLKPIILLEKLFLGVLELVFVVLLPFIFFYLDRLDRDKHHTLGYNCRCRKVN